MWGIKSSTAQGGFGDSAHLYRIPAVCQSRRGKVFRVSDQGCQRVGPDASAIDRICIQSNGLAIKLALPWCNEPFIRNVGPASNVPFSVSIPRTPEPIAMQFGLCPTSLECLCGHQRSFNRSRIRASADGHHPGRTCPDKRGQVSRIFR